MWVEEHLPIIFNEAESRYTADIGHWRTLALRRGIGLRRDSRQRRDRRAQLPSDIHATEPSVSSKPIDGSLLDIEHLALQPADSLDTGDRVMTSSLPLSDSCAQASECSVGLGLKTSVVDSASDGFSGYQTTSVLNDPLDPFPQHGSITAPSIEDCCATSVTEDCISTPSPKGLQRYPICWRLQWYFIRRQVQPISICHAPFGEKGKKSGNKNDKTKARKSKPKPTSSTSNSLPPGYCYADCVLNWQSWRWYDTVLFMYDVGPYFVFWQRSQVRRRVDMHKLP